VKITQHKLLHFTLIMSRYIWSLS